MVTTPLVSCVLHITAAAVQHGDVHLTAASLHPLVPPIYAALDREKRVAKLTPSLIILLVETPSRTLYYCSSLSLVGCTTVVHPQHGPLPPCARLCMLLHRARRMSLIVHSVYFMSHVAIIHRRATSPTRRVMEQSSFGGWSHATCLAGQTRTTGSKRL